ncbi:hypothetical protein HZS_7674 [Henneguya salminicola]|nr:hypothetical protein HZS_7674 [Henneguya salminicola]
MSNETDLDYLFKIFNDTDSFIFFVLSAIIMLIGFLIMMTIFLVKKNRPFYNRRDLFFSAVNKKIRVKPESKCWLWSCYFWESEKIFNVLGLDSLILLRTTKLFLFISSLVAVLTLSCALPVHLSYGKSNLSLLIITSFSVIPEGSNLLWVHFGLVYAITLIILIILYFEWIVVVKYRQRYFLLDPQYTNSLLFSDLGNNATNEPWDEYLKDKIKKIIGESDEFIVYMLKNIGFLKKIIRKHDSLVARRYNSMITSPTNSNYKLVSPNAPFLYSGPDSEKIDEILSQNYVELEKTANHMNDHSLDAAIVMISNVGLAQALRCTSFSLNQNQVHVSVIPEHTGIIWRNLAVDKNIKKLSSGLIHMLTALVILFWAVPFVVVSGISKLIPIGERATYQFTSKFFMKMLAFLSNTLIPLILIQIIFYLEHRMFKKLSTYENHISYAAAEFSILKKMCLFNAINAFFIYTISSSIFDFIDTLFQKPLELTAALASSIPLQSNFYMIYLTFHTCIILPWMFIKGNYFLWYCYIWIKCFFTKTKESPESCPDNICRPIDPEYIYKYSYLILVFGISLVFSLLSPLISAISVVYFGTAYALFAYDEERNNLNKYLYYGEFWCIVSNLIISYLAFMQILMIGIFTIKKYFLLTLLMIPCTIFTVFYSKYLSNVFNKSFKYPTCDTMKEIKTITQIEMYNKCKNYYAESFVPEMNETSIERTWKYVLKRELALHPNI